MDLDLIEPIFRLVRMLRRQAPDMGALPRGGMRILQEVLHEEGIRTSDLAERLDIRPASLTEALGRLAEEGLIRRERDEQDSRVSHVLATDKAREENVKFQAGHQLRNQRLCACLTREEAEGFLRVCDKLYAALKQEEASCSG